MARIQGDTVETTLTTNTRDYEAGFKRARDIQGRFIADTNRAFAQIGAGMGRGGLLPGLSNISNIIQSLPTIGNLAGALISPLRHATEEGIRFNMMIESAEAGFVGVARGIEGARKHVEALRKFGEDSPLFETEGLIRVSQLMNVFGFQLSEHIPKVKIWGDAIAASGELNEEVLLGVARAFGQMRAVGRVTAEDMNQLSDRGIAGWELLAKAIGKTVAETRKLGEQGRLNGPAAVEAITAMIAQDPRFKGTAERQAGTLAGRLARLQEIQSRAQGIATEGLTRDISGALEAGLQGEDVAMRMAGSINAAIAPVSGMIRATVVGAIGGGITTGLQEGIEAGKGAVSGAMQTFAVDSVIGPFKAALGIQSPSKVFMELGEMAAEGFFIGFEQRLKQGGGRGVGHSSDRRRGVAQWDDLINRIAAETGVDSNLIRAVMMQESGGNPRVVSHAGARGLMQLMPGTARRYGVTNSFNPEQNIRGGATYLRDLLKMFGGRTDLALAGYNWGEHRSALRRAHETGQSVFDYQLPGETRAYVKTVEQNYARLRQGGGQLEAPVPVRVVGGAGRVNFTKTPVHDAQGNVIGYDAQDPRDMGLGGTFSDDMARHVESLGFGDNLPFFPGIGAERLLQPSSTAFASITTGIKSATEAQFELLAAIGQTGPALEQGFQQGEAAAGSFYASVVRQAGDAKAVFGITAKDMKSLFEDSLVSSFTRTDLNFKGMVGNMALTFAQGVNQMVQTWAASQLSNLLGKVIGAIAGSIAGGIGGGGKVSAVGMIPGRASGGPVEAGTLYETHGLNRREFFVPEVDGQIVTRGQMRPAQVTNIKNINITLPPPRPADNVRTRVSQREQAENLLALLR